MDDHIRINSKSLLRTASLLALCGILLGILVGAYAYSRGRNASLDVIRESNLNLARSFSLHAESLDPTLTKPQILQQLAHNWSATESRYDGRYLCVIDWDGTILLHSASPDEVGSAAGGDYLQSHVARDPTTVQELLDSGRDWSGQCPTQEDPQRAGSLVYSQDLGILVGIYTPGNEIARDVRSAALPWALSVGFISIVLIPIIILFLHRAYRLSQRELEPQSAALLKENAERKRLAAFPRVNPNPIMECTADGEVIYHNPAAMELIGDLVQGITSFLLPENHQHLASDCVRHQRCVVEVETRVAGRNFLWTYLPIPESDTVHLYGVDNTERREAEEQIKSSLKEKEVLLQEVYHRVKNNMQIVSSLLRRQATLTDDPHVKAILAESRNRIYSMALVHQQLYQSKSLEGVDLSTYIRNLTGYLVPQGGSDLRLNLVLESVEVDIAIVIPCGLILNELISNAMKYAYPSGRGGMIDVVLRRGSANGLTLAVRDAGVGIPDDVDSENPQSLGLRLVRDLTQQLDGDLLIDTAAGTAITLTIPHGKTDSQTAETTQMERAKA
jgi:two-component sensor histidine kinase